MPACPNCNHKLNSKKLFKSFWSFNSYSNIPCPSCSVTLAHTSKNRLYGGLSIGITLFISFAAYALSNETIGIKVMISGCTTIIVALILSTIAVSYFSFEITSKNY